MWVARHPATAPTQAVRLNATCTAISADGPKASMA